MVDKLHVIFGVLPEACTVESVHYFDGRSRVVCHSVGRHFFELDFIVSGSVGLAVNDALNVIFKDDSCVISDGVQVFDFLDFSVFKRFSC